MDDRPAAAASPAVPHAPASRMIRRWAAENAQVGAVAVILIGASAIYSVLTPFFLTAQNIGNIALQSAPTLIVATVMTLVMATAGIDLSVGSLIAFVSAYSALMLQGGYPDSLVIVAMLGAGLFFGALQGWFVAYQALPPFIVTLAGLIAIRGLALFATEGHSFFITTGHPFLWFGQGHILTIPTGTLLSLAVALVGIFVLDRTTLGRHAVGIGSNQEAVRRAGVDVRRLKVAIYALSGIAAAVASFITTARLGSGSANVAVGFELSVIAAVVLGGTSLFGGRATMVGTIFGTYAIAVIENGLILLHVSPFLTGFVEGMIIILAIWTSENVVRRLRVIER